MFQGLLPNGINPHDLFYYIDFRGSVSKDRFIGTDFTSSNVAFGADQNNSITATMNGTTSDIDCGTSLVGVGDITVCVFIDLVTHGEGNFGRICDNGQFIFLVSDAIDGVEVSSDGASTIAASASNTILDGQSYFLAATRTSAGVANIYIDGVLSGSADQASGTPVAASTNMIIGNNDTSTRTFNGGIRFFQIYNKILTVIQIGRIFNRFK